MSGREFDQGAFVVVRNDDDQHSIWPGSRALPAGWHEAGFTGSREDCLSHIERVWPDIRPARARQIGG